MAQMRIRKEASHPPTNGDDLAVELELGSAADVVVLRRARVRDGAAMWRLVRATGALDENSPYAYLMFASHFGSTCVVAERAGELVGFVLAFRPPRRPQVVFVWQIAVAASARGQGLGRRLLETLVTQAGVRQPGCRGVQYLEATVTPSNEASRALFRGFARVLGATCEESPGFAAEWFPGEHEAEDLFRIGPFGVASGGRAERTLREQP